MFPKFYRNNKFRINLLYTQVLDERFTRDLTLEIQKDIDVNTSRQEQIEIIEKRILLQKPTRKHKKKHVHRIDYDCNCDIRTYTHYKSKKEFEYAVNDEIKKVEEESEDEDNLVPVES
jgi:hypothetical protein